MNNIQNSNSNVSAENGTKPNVVRCFSSPVEIIGVGYGKDVEQGESYLQESVINMWSFAPDGAFTYYSEMVVK